jgi:spore germination protein GerM
MTVRLIRLAAIAIVAMLAGCGVTVERSPRPITPVIATPTGGATPDATPSAVPGDLTEVLYFAKDGKLVAVRRSTKSPPTLEIQLQHLLAGPNDAERDTGLTSALTGLSVTAQVRLHERNATVDLGNRPDNAGRSDEVLAYGQLVCTLTTRVEVDTVSFRYDGQHVDVPRGDGSLVKQPLTADDYAILIADG